MDIRKGFRKTVVINTTISQGAAKLRPSLLDQVSLSDGRLAWPVARDMGMCEAAFRKRLKDGLSPDEVISKPYKTRDFAGAKARWEAQRAKRRQELASRPAAAPLKENPRTDEERESLEYGVPLAVYRARRRAGTPHFLAILRAVR